MLKPEQLLARKQGIGGSDIAAICGLSRWKTPLGVYFDKTSDEIEDQLSDNEAIHFGNKLEPIIAEEYALRTGYTVSCDETTFRHKDYDFMIAHIDRWVGEKEFILECKTTGAYLKDMWGTPGTDEIPEYYLTQVAWYAAICDVPRVDIAVLIGGQNFRIYTYTRNPAFEQRLIEIGAHFWKKYVQNRVPPAPSDSQDLAQLYKVSNELSTVIDQETLEKLTRFKELKATERELTDEMKTLQFEIQAFMKDNGVLTDSSGTILATWKQGKPREVFDTKRFKEEHPELYAEYVTKREAPRMFILKQGRGDV